MVLNGGTVAKTAYTTDVVFPNSLLREEHLAKVTKVEELQAD